MSTDSSSSEDLSKFESVAISGEAVHLGAQAVKVSRRRDMDIGCETDVNRLNEGEKKLGPTEDKLWDALERRLDRDLAQSPESSESESEKRSVPAADSRPDAAQNGAAEEINDFRFFSPPSASHRRNSAKLLQQPSEPEKPGQKLQPGRKVGKKSGREAELDPEPASSPALASFTALEEVQPGRKRTHDEMVQFLGEDAPAAPNRKERRCELQGRKAQKRAKAAAKLAKGGKEAQEEAAAQLSEKAKATLASKVARHERDRAKVVKRRKRHALRDAENERRVKRGLAPIGPAPSQTEAPVKVSRKPVSRGKFSTARARKVKSEKAMEKGKTKNKKTGDRS